MKQVSVTEVEHKLAEFLELAASEDIVLTRHGKPVGVLVGFEDEHDWFEYHLENSAKFLEQIAEAREDLRKGHGVRLEEIDFQEEAK